MRDNMRAERIRLNMTASEVANKIGVHENAVLRWESGDNDPLGTNLIKLANLYDCSPDYLLGLTDERKRS